MLRAVQGAADHRSDTHATAAAAANGHVDPNTEPPFADADLTAAGGCASPREASDRCPSDADAPLIRLSSVSDEVGPDEVGPDEVGPDEVGPMGGRRAKLW